MSINPSPSAPRGRPRNRSLTLLAILLLAGLLGGVIIPRYAPGGWLAAVQAPAPAPAPAVPPPATGPGAGPGTSPPVAQFPLAAPAPGPNDRGESVIVRVVQNVRPAVVNISIRAQVSTPFGLFPQVGQGSGVIVRPDGLILTNNHVIQAAQEITVTLLSGRTLQGRVLGADRFSDIAVVKVDSPQRLPAVEMGASGPLQVGQTAIAIGNPFGLGSTVTVGVVSALNRSIKADQDFTIESLIQTDAAINPGNSGGALLDSGGRLIGINTAIIQGAQGIGFAIPIDHARVIMEQIIAQGKVVRPALGVEILGEINPGTARSYNLPVQYGVVAMPQPGSPAERAGMRRQDIIVAIDGQKVESTSDMRRELFKKKPGDTVKVEIVREGKRQTLTIVLTELRSSLSRGAIV